MFERVYDGDRPHPRMRVSMPPVSDPDPDHQYLDTDEPTPPVDEFLGWLRAIYESASSHIRAGHDGEIPAASERFWSNSLRVQRAAAFFAEVEQRVEQRMGKGKFDAGSQGAYLAHLRRIEDEAYAGIVTFDDNDTGTYHSFGHDAPFVHFLEQILVTLPEEGKTDLMLLDGNQQESIRRQRHQAQRHLDHLMRHKYANEGIVETDIERSLGGYLIDRGSRRVVSEDPRSRAQLMPIHELLRIEPGADHPHNGSWVFRDGTGGFRLDDDRGTSVDLDESLLRSIPVDAGDLTFLRAPDDRDLRPDVRFDWDGNGYVQDMPLEWIDWAGHCDIKAIMEQLGLSLDDQPSVTEYRSDTARTAIYDRDLLIEMIAAVMELGSLYSRADGSGLLQRGIHRFGGSRNDSRPDRLQFLGLGPGRSFRWPLSGRQDSFRVVGIEVDGERLDPAKVFYRYIADVEGLDFIDNPRYLKTIEGDYSLVDVTGALLQAEILEERFDARTGYPDHKSTTITIDLRDDAEQTRFYLGTHISDPSVRELYRLYLDRARQLIEAECYRYEFEGGRYLPRRLDDRSEEIPLAAPLSVTLSHEMKRDNPEVFQNLLTIAMRQAQNICADTDMQAQVWNGVVTDIEAEKIDEDPDRGVECWLVHIKARFGDATLGYLLRRDHEGQPEAYCPIDDENAWGQAPDFLWQDYPDIASKGVEQDDWVINHAMLERGIVDVRHEPTSPGGFYVYDDHIKNVFELIFSGLGGYPWTIVHGNKRYGFEDEATWREAVDRLEHARNRLRYE